MTTLQEVVNPGLLRLPSTHTPFPAAVQFHLGNGLSVMYALSRVIMKDTHTSIKVEAYISLVPHMCTGTEKPEDPH